jgi:hypothetical protein
MVFPREYTGKSVRVVFIGAAKIATPGTVWFISSLWQR